MENHNKITGYLVLKYKFYKIIIKNWYDTLKKRKK